MALQVVGGATALKESTSILPSSLEGSLWQADDRTFPNNLRALRERMRWTQRQLASHLGINRARLSLWESGRTLPRWGSLEVLMSLYEVSLSQIYPDRAIQSFLSGQAEEH